jgi:hypothetical protein
MGIGSWFKRLRAKEDEAAIERAVERQGETAEERHVEEGGIDGLRADERGARDLHEGSVEDAERFAEGD